MDAFWIVFSNEWEHFLTIAVYNIPIYLIIFFGMKRGLQLSTNHYMSVMVFAVITVFMMYLQRMRVIDQHTYEPIPSKKQVDEWVMEWLVASIIYIVLNALCLIIASIITLVINKISKEGDGFNIFKSIILPLILYFVASPIVMMMWYPAHGK